MSVPTSTNGDLLRMLLAATSYLGPYAPGSTPDDQHLKELTLLVHEQIYTVERKGE